MIFELVKIIYSALSFGFDAVQDVFDSIGIPWVAAVCVMVLVSVVLRLFTAQFIGNAIVSISSRRKAKSHKKED